MEMFRFGRVNSLSSLKKSVVVASEDTRKFNLFIIVRRLLPSSPGSVYEQIAFSSCLFPVWTALLAD